MEDATPVPLLQQPHLNLPPTMSPSSLLLDALPTPSDRAHIARLLNPSHSRSPSKPIYSDRFIPSRSGSNFALFGLNPSPKPAPADGKDEISSSSAAYSALLRAALFGPDTPERKDEPFSASRNIFRYKTETKRPLHSIMPFGFEDEDPAGGASRGPAKAPRKVPRSPYKVLDAPALQDDFYLNLVDWSPHNVLAVGLGNCVYLWNACSSKVTKLCDLGIDDSVCSVGWAQRGTHLAVGTRNGKLQ
ncbi:hypothetical protein CRG98_015137, partial [Punica granatum]